jgi:sugar phosphate isomerase/epimerase
MPRIVSLAAGVILDALPPLSVEVAQRAGYPAAGLWFDVDRWSASTSVETRNRLDATGVVPLDIEVVRIGPGPLSDTNRRLVAAGGEVGARNVLCIGTDPDHGAVAARFAEVCELAAETGMRAVLEFMRFTTIRSLGEALEVVATAGHPAGGVLVDALHFDRCGHSPADLAGVDPALLPYAQLCDAPRVRPAADDAALIREALDLRLNCGEGGLDLRGLLAALPDGLPLSMELRSAALRDGWPDPVDRARVVRERTEAYLAASV